jgi:hypothetical protein
MPKKIIARLSFNTNGWQSPSGLTGKSVNKIHESIYGFGFEEWLFNKNFVDKDGYHFGYIEGIHKNFQVGDNVYPIELFTIDKRTRKRYLVAIIKVWHSLSTTESSILISNNLELINLMKADLQTIDNLNALNKFNQHLDNHNSYQLFNFKFKDVEYLNNAIPKSSSVYKMNRFWLHRVK